MQRTIKYKICLVLLVIILMLSIKKECKVIYKEVEKASVENSGLFNSSPIAKSRNLILKIIAHKIKDLVK